jgi:hypothetical protein
MGLKTQALYDRTKVQAVYARPRGVELPAYRCFKYRETAKAGQKRSNDLLCVTLFTK